MKKKNEIQKELDELGVGEFNKEHKRLKKMIKSNETDSSLAGQQLTKTLLAMTIEMLPKIEKQFIASDGSKGIYAIVNLSNLIRELVNDLRSMSDQSELVEKIMDTSVDSNLLILSNSVHNAMLSIDSVAVEHLDKRQRRLIREKTQSVRKEVLERVEVIRDAIQGQLTDILNS